MSYFKGFGSGGSNSYGQFWYGPYGFLYKKNTGVSGRKNPKVGLIINKQTDIYNKYTPGQNGIGAQSIANRRAKNRIASICSPGTPCGKFYNKLGMYDHYLYNPNGYYYSP